MSVDGASIVISWWKKKQVRVAVYVITGLVILSLVVRNTAVVYHEKRVATENYNTLNCRDLSVHADSLTRDNLRYDCARLRDISSRIVVLTVLSRIVNTIFIEGAHIITDALAEFSVVFFTVGAIALVILSIPLLQRYMSAHTPGVQVYAPPWAPSPLPPPQYQGNPYYAYPPYQPRLLRADNTRNGDGTRDYDVE